MKRNLFIAVSLIIIVSGLAIFLNYKNFNKTPELNYSGDYTLKELAQKNNFSLKELFQELNHGDTQNAFELSRDIPLKNIKSVEPADFRTSLKHIKGNKTPVMDTIKYILWAVFMGIVLIFILPEKKIKKKRKDTMLVAFHLFGIFLAATPNPMEPLVEVFKLSGPTSATVLSLIIFTLLSIAGSKLLCSWGCQLGTLQESFFNIPILRKKKRKLKVSFLFSIVTRILIFVVFAIFLYSYNSAIYKHVNYFNFFSFSNLTFFAFYSLPLFFILSLFFYRPFCHFICPFGLYSWLLENISLNSISVDYTVCIDCDSCIKDCPTEAMKDIHHAKRDYFLADCWSCGNCIETCSEDAVEYGGRKSHVPLFEKER